MIVIVSLSSHIVLSSSSSSNFIIIVVIVIMISIIHIHTDIEVIMTASLTNVPTVRARHGIPPRDAEDSKPMTAPSIG